MTNPPTLESAPLKPLFMPQVIVLLSRNALIVVPPHIDAP